MTEVQELVNRGTGMGIPDPEEGLWTAVPELEQY